jgi:hypothetical protein
LKRASPTTGNIVGRRFGRLEVIGCSDKRGSRGARTVPLLECRYDCGNITYKATDKLTNPDLSMCNDCSGKYAGQRVREKAAEQEPYVLTKEICDYYGVENIYKIIRMCNAIRFQ